MAKSKREWEMLTLLFIPGEKDSCGVPDSNDGGSVAQIQAVRSKQGR